MKRFVKVGGVFVKNKNKELNFSVELFKENLLMQRCHFLLHVFLLLWEFLLHWFRMNLQYR